MKVTEMIGTRWGALTVVRRAKTQGAVPRLEPDERDRLADDLARQCQQCTHDQEDHESE